MKHLFAAFIISILFTPAMSFAHCDTMQGPVITDAKKALAAGDVTPVLKWVKKEYEGQIRDLFRKTLVVRVKGEEARELADMYFFETLVRLHRAGEGAPYTGIKSEPVEPIIAMSDNALDSGTVDELAKALNKRTEEKLKELFSAAMEKKKSANISIEAGREYVQAYVKYIHFVEALRDAIRSGGGEHHE